MGPDMSHPKLRELLNLCEPWGGVQDILSW